MPSPDRLRVLAKEIDTDLQQADRLARDLAGARARWAQSPSQEELVYVGYMLHGIYSAWESAFHRIASTFENRLDPGQWHAELLERMALDIPGLRPSVIGQPELLMLHKLRAFRHFFRHNYAAPMDFDEIQLVLKRYDEAFAQVGARLHEFIRKLDQLSDGSEQRDQDTESQS